MHERRSMKIKNHPSQIRNNFVTDTIAIHGDDALPAATRPLCAAQRCATRRYMTDEKV